MYSRVYLAVYNVGYSFQCIGSLSKLNGFPSSGVFVFQQHLQGQSHDIFKVVFAMVWTLQIRLIFILLFQRLIQLYIYWRIPFWTRINAKTSLIDTVYRRFTANFFSVLQLLRPLRPVRRLLEGFKILPLNNKAYSGKSSNL